MKGYECNLLEGPIEKNIKPTLADVLEEIIVEKSQVFKLPRTDPAKIVDEL